MVDPADSKSFAVVGTLIDVVGGRVYPGEVVVSAGVITALRATNEPPRAPYICPPLVNAHNHIESMLMTPREASRVVVAHGVLGMVSDPHEIANVAGTAGVRYMLAAAVDTDLVVSFGAPSCVPATNCGIETSGAVLGPREVIELLHDPAIGYLAEVMNYPAVLARDPGFMEMIGAATKLGKPVDGHAPGLRGDDARRYAAAGITTDHECFAAAEARDKLAAGMKIIVREGSAARNLDALTEIVDEFPDRTMLCTDDLHPDLAEVGSIDRHVARLIGAGVDPLKVLRAASRNPIEHYRLALGQLQVGDPADFIVVGDLADFRVDQVYRRGRLVAANGRSTAPFRPSGVINRFGATPIDSSAVQLRAAGPNLRAVRVIEHQLITELEIVSARVVGGLVESDPATDVLKIVVVNRYTPAPVSVGFVTRFGLKRGALASSVAHDCHNIVAVGTNDRDLVAAVNRVIEAQGGLAFACGDTVECLPLPIGGLMSGEDHATVTAEYIALDRVAKTVGGTALAAPFMTLSFLALLVIPAAKISDRGVFVDFKPVAVSF